MHHRHRERHHGERFARGAFGRDWPERDGGPGHHDRHERGGRRSGRVFDHGELRLVVLALIAERPRHGYEIIKAVEERLAGTYSPSPGVVYPTLTMLEEIGHATVTEAESKKLYAITADGQAYLTANAAGVAAVLAKMEEVRALNGGGPAPGIIRAISNLKMALRLRQGRGPLTEAQTRSIAEAIDAAAIAIERS